MKHIVTASLLLFSTVTNAAIFYSTGKVSTLSITDSSVAVEGPVLSITGVTSAGSCYVDSSGLVPILIKVDDKGKAQYSMALSAYMAGKTIKVELDDTNKNANNYCYLRWIGLNSSAN